MVTEIVNSSELLNLFSDKKILIYLWSENTNRDGVIINQYLEEISKEYLNILVVKINVDIHPDFLIRYNINSTPHFVFVDKDGNRIDHGGFKRTKQNIVELFKNYL